MTYLSILAWMIGNYKFAGGDSRFDNLHRKLCDTLNRRMLQSHDCNLPSFPNGVVFFPDMMFAVIALKDYGRLYNDEFQPTVDKWLSYCKNDYINSQTGLLYACYFRNRSQGRTSGAYSGLNTSGLALIDQDFARRQYDLMKKALVVRFGNNAAVKEYLKGAPKLTFDIDAGPVVYGLSPSGTAFAIGAATYFRDWDLREKLLNSVSLVGHTVRNKNKRHYRLAEILMTGEAITLAMRTMVNFDEMYRYDNMTKEEIILEINALVHKNPANAEQIIVARAKKYIKNIETIKNYDYEKCPFMWQMPDPWGSILPGAKDGYTWCLLTWLCISGSKVYAIRGLGFHSGPPDGFQMKIDEVDKEVLIAIVRCLNSQVPIQNEKSNKLV